MKKNRPTFCLVTLGLILSALAGGCQNQSQNNVETLTLTPSQLLPPAFTSSLPVTQTPFVITATSVPEMGAQDVFILSMLDNGYAHLFLFSPLTNVLIRLTSSPWDDIAPSLSPDGTKVAFTSRRNGYWNLFLLNLVSGESSPLTDDLDYENAPTWSPDGLWLAFETYRNGNLDLDIISVDNPADRQKLTESPSADFSPVWSPQGRQIAFASDRKGENDIWIADLDKLGDERFRDVSNSPTISETHPAWSPDGRSLSWAGAPVDSSMEGIYVWDARTDDRPKWACSGDWPVWALDGTRVFTRLMDPNQMYLSGISLSSPAAFPPTRLGGVLRGLDFGHVDLSSLPQGLIQAGLQSPTPLFEITNPTGLGNDASHLTLVDLQDVQAPYPRMLNILDDAFSALRSRVADEVGWDALVSLENAFVPLTIALDPGFGEDWLYTGRAFSLNPVLLEAGWMVIVKEEVDQQTYWRVYLRARSQDGSQGEPLHQVPWKIYSRYSGIPIAYDQGGLQATSIPSGFWVDLTSLAASYGWERLPALPNWQAFIRGARFGEFVFTSGLDWKSAMLQLYPAQVFITPTLVPSATLTPSRTPWHYRTPTPTQTLTPRPTLTIHP